MKKTKTKQKKEVCKTPSCNTAKCGCMYGLAFLGAAIHYLSVATGFWSGVLGILKAAVWPVFLVLKILGM